MGGAWPLVEEHTVQTRPRHYRRPSNETNRQPLTCGTEVGRLWMPIFYESWPIPHLKWYDQLSPATLVKKDDLKAMIIEDTLGRLLLTAIVMSDDRFFVGAGIGANRDEKVFPRMLPDENTEPLRVLNTFVSLPMSSFTL